MDSKIVRILTTAIEKEELAWLTMKDGRRLQALVIDFDTLNEIPHVRIIEGQRVQFLPIADITDACHFSALSGA